MPLYTKDLVCVKCLRPCTRQKRRGGVSNSKKLLHSIFFKGNPRNRGQRDSVSPARRFLASRRSRGHWSETESGNDSGKAGELSTSGCPSVNHICRQQGSKEALPTCEKCRSAPAGRKLHFFQCIGHNSGAECRMRRLICMVVQKMAKMSTKKSKKSGQCPLNA